MISLTEYDDFRALLRAYIIRTIADFVRLDKVYEVSETPDGDTEQWDIEFKDSYKLRVEITKQE